MREFEAVQLEGQKNFIALAFNVSAFISNC